MLKITCKGAVNIFTVLLCVLTMCTANDYRPNEHQKFILNGVTTVLKTTSPAVMSLLNDNAFPILTGLSDGVRKAHVAAAEWGKGRMVAYSHTTLYIADLPVGVKNDNLKLLINSINWLRKDAGKKIGVYGYDPLEKYLTEFTIYEVSREELNNWTLLKQYDVVVIAREVRKDFAENLRTYVQNGGGLLVGGTAWSVSGDEQLESYWPNVILRDTGILCISKYSYGSESCDGKCFDATTDLLKDTNSFQVWQELKGFNWNQQVMPRVQINQMMEVLVDRLRFGSNEKLNDEVKTFAQRCLELIPAFVPTEEAPVKLENEKQFIVAYRYWIELLNLIGVTADISPHPAAKVFPGTSASVIEQRIKKVVEIDGRIKWHSTGLYALPGHKITVQALNPEISATDLQVQIGMHDDNLEKLDNWNRYPVIVFQSKIKNGTATIANPFGGPIFIVSSNKRSNSLKFTIDGGIRSPTYFLGQTTQVEWQNEIRNYPAPWGELVGKNLIISIQSTFLSQLKDPEEVIKFWDLVSDTMADLAVIPRDRDTQSRFVADVQISAGFMHSGYPIMFKLGRQRRCISMEEARADPWNLWGYLHELGHNHQVSDWTFKGTTEVTCNLFPLYVVHTLFNRPTSNSSDFTDADVASRIRPYVKDGKIFSVWQSDPWLAIQTYIQLQEAFGWSAYKKVFREYQLMPENKRPKNEEEKIDLWMETFSKAVNQNLVEFFISWGIPISKEAIKRVEHLPATSLRIRQL